MGGSSRGPGNPGVTGCGWALFTDVGEKKIALRTWCLRSRSAGGGGGGGGAFLQIETRKRVQTNGKVIHL